MTPIFQLVPSIKPPSTSFKAAPEKKILKTQRSRYSLLKNAVKEDIKNGMSDSVNRSYETTKSWAIVRFLQFFALDPSK